MRAATSWIFVSAAVALSACSKEYRVEKRVDDLKVTLIAGSYPLLLGDNPLMLRITEQTGEAINGAAVKARYWLPPMPGMGAVESVTEAALATGGFSFIASTHTAARWNVEVTISRPGKRDSQVGFTLEAL